MRLDLPRCRVGNGGLCAAFMVGLGATGSDLVVGMPG
jgi:hypothetical protein